MAKVVISCPECGEKFDSSDPVNFVAPATAAGVGAATGAAIGSGIGLATGGAGMVATIPFGVGPH